mmetsp:Transcript_25790/g.42343  ORF Transcript_25790/g.42343 Transcript_25790/m.42343 type:complete len:139 (+) Transcript_25790:160-576(+)
MAKDAMTFQAMPLDRTAIEQPFLPKKANDPPTVPDDFELNSTARAEDRAKYDADRVTRDAEWKRVQDEQERLAKEEEDKAVHQMRKEMTFKAQPIRHYKDVDHSMKMSAPLTEPISPKFNTEQRARIREEQQHATNHH